MKRGRLHARLPRASGWRWRGGRAWRTTACRWTWASRPPRRASPALCSIATPVKPVSRRVPPTWGLAPLPCLLSSPLPCGPLHPPPLRVRIRSALTPRLLGPRFYVLRREACYCACSFVDRFGKLLQRAVAQDRDLTVRARSPCRFALRPCCLFRLHQTPLVPRARLVARRARTDDWETDRACATSLENWEQVAVVGGGAGGVELAMSVHHRLLGELAKAGRPSAGRGHRQVRFHVQGPTLM